MKEYRKSEWKWALKAIFIVAVLCVGVGIAVAAWDDTKSTGDALTAAEWNAQVTDQKTKITDDTSVPKNHIVNSGVLGFDWTDDEVSNTLTCSAGDSATDFFAAGTLNLVRIPTILTGKDADSVDGIEGSEIFKKDGSIAATGDFLPDTSGLRKLGSTTKRWGDIHSDNHRIINVLYGGFSVGQDFLPNSNENYTLGSETYKWDMVWARTVDFNSVCTDLMNRMSDGDYINFTDGISFNGASGQSIVNVAHLLPKTTGAGDLGSSALKFQSVYTGDIIAWDGLSGGIKCEQDWLPKTDDTYDLGSVSYYWNDMFLKGYIDLKGSLYTSTINEQPGGAGVTIDGCLIKDGYPYIPNHTPSTASETCAAGQICYDSSYTYVCIATNTWERAALSSW